MKTRFEKSKAKGTANFVYLALGDEIIINNGKPNEWGLYHAKDDNLNELWIRGDDEDNNKVLTMLISYEDEECKYDDDYEKYHQHFLKTLQGQICNLGNLGKNEERWEIIFDIMNDALVKLDNKTFKKVYKSLDNLKFYSREVDFGMHEPNAEYVHPGFDT